MPMHSQIETLTPARAAEILGSKNPNNRPVSRERVRRYAQEMREGRWVLTPQGLAFDSAGNLLDGQHRLAAVVQANEPQAFYVAHDVPREALRGLDQGLGRTAAQMAALEMTSDVPVSRLTSAARIVLEHGFGVAKPSNTAIINFAREHTAALERYAPLGKQHTAGVHGAFSFADMSGLRGVQAAATRLVEMSWSGDGDPMRALARALGTLGGRDGARAQRTRFFTALAVLEYVDRGEDLLVARKYEAMPGRVKDSVRTHAGYASDAPTAGGAVYQ